MGHDRHGIHIVVLTIGTPGHRRFHEITLIVAAIYAIGEGIGNHFGAS
jgi:hypothetical protein